MLHRSRANNKTDTKQTKAELKPCGTNVICLLNIYVEILKPYRSFPDSQPLYLDVKSAWRQDDINIKRRYEYEIQGSYHTSRTFGR
jgi:hypothetical protein